MLPGTFKSITGGLTILSGSRQVRKPGVCSYAKLKTEPKLVLLNTGALYNTFELTQ